MANVKDVPYLLQVQCLCWNLRFLEWEHLCYVFTTRTCYKTGPGDFTYTTHRLTAGRCQKHCYTGMLIDKWLLLSLTSSDQHGTTWVVTSVRDITDSTCARAQQALVQVTCVHEWGMFNVLMNALVRKLCMKILKFIGLIRALQTKLVHTSLVFLVCHEYLLCDPV